MALYKSKSRLLLTTCVNWSENYAYICVAHFQNVTDFFRVSGERERFWLGISCDLRSPVIF